MPKLPRLKAKEIIATLKKEGFFVSRVTGSHHVLKSNDGRRTVIPVHANEIIGPGLFRKILSDCELTPEEFLFLLRR